MTEITKLINNIETLFNVFVPGALCVWCYMKLSLKKIEYQGYLVLSIALGFVIKYIVDYIDKLLGSSVIVGFPIVIVYVAVGITSAIAFYKIKNSLCVRDKLSKFLGIESGDNIWTRHLDPCGNLITLHMDDGTYILGRFENSDDEYITLTDYCFADTPDEKSMDDASETPHTDAVLCVPTSHVKRFEIIYNHLDSETAKYVLR